MTPDLLTIPPPKSYGAPADLQHRSLHPPGPHSSSRHGHVGTANAPFLVNADPTLESRPAIAQPTAPKIHTGRGGGAIYKHGCEGRRQCAGTRQQRSQAKQNHKQRHLKAPCFGIRFVLISERGERRTLWKPWSTARHPSHLK